jgi:hypothetical protein
VSESTPAFSARVKDSAITSIVPRIKEFPKSLNFGAVATVERMMWQKVGTQTFFDIPPEIDDLPSSCRDEKVGNFLLRAIVAAHYRDQQALRGSRGGAEYGTRDEPSMRHGTDQIVQFT